MSDFSTHAILLRRIDHGDYDLIVTLMTKEYGKLSLIAKNAKKSIKRFSGVLELFSALDIVGKKGRGKLPVLMEASLVHPYTGIRSDILKTAYASYFAEVVNIWVEEGKPQKDLYLLLEYVLHLLDRQVLSGEELSIIFQIRFLSLSGLSPNLTECGQCRTILEQFHDNRIYIDFSKGGILCSQCTSSRKDQRQLSAGTIKQLLWVNSGDLKKAERIRFTPRAVMEGLDFLEKFVLFQVGREPNSLKFLRNIRMTK
ncbi:MAG: DNA repair protein RecO [Pseudomonadota bacterium]